MSAVLVESCPACGRRAAAADAPTERPPPELTLGSVVAGYVVSDLLSSSALLGSRDGGPAVTLYLGSEGALDLEMEALRRLAGDPRFARAVGRERDPMHGSVLVVEPPPGDEMAIGDADDAIVLLSSLVELAAVVEALGFAFCPRAEDLRSDRGQLRLARLRGARRLGRDARLDPRALLGLVGAGLVSLLADMDGPTRLVRLLAPGRARGPQDLDAFAEELRLAREERPREDGSVLAGLVDAGLWRPYNQDAVVTELGAGSSGPWAVFALCDGVSSSSTSGAAADEASRVAAAELAAFARASAGDASTDADAVRRAVFVANRAVCALPLDEDDDVPGTTLVLSLVRPGRLTVGWVGDSRAYWVSDHGAELLTRDHSWLNEIVARGELSEDEARASPDAHTLTRCLGPCDPALEDLGELLSDVRTRDLSVAGTIVVCSDGLWGYAESAPEIAALVRAAGATASAATIARRLVNFALGRGGHDNVSVVVFRYGGEWVGAAASSRRGQSTSP